MQEYEAQKLVRARELLGLPGRGSTQDDTPEEDQEVSPAMFPSIAAAPRGEIRASLPEGPIISPPQTEVAEGSVATDKGDSQTVMTTPDKKNFSDKIKGFLKIKDKPATDLTISTSVLPDAGRTNKRSGSKSSAEPRLSAMALQLKGTASRTSLPLLIHAY